MRRRTRPKKSSSSNSVFQTWFVKNLVQINRMKDLGNLNYVLLTCKTCKIKKISKSTKYFFCYISSPKAEEVIFKTCVEFIVEKKVWFCSIQFDSEIFFPFHLFHLQNSMYETLPITALRKKWYFVSKFVLTYCEKKLLKW